MIGHEWAVDLLAEHVSKGRERHSYLITGPLGVGRRTLALRFAEALNCPNMPHPGQPCRTCPSCRRIEAMQHPDLTIVEAARQGAVLKIDQVRELQHNLSLSPFEARYRVALLLRFEEANPAAANALLKTLEEPPAQVVMILTAQGVETLLPTIVSRCEILRLRPVSIDQTSIGLQTIYGVPTDSADKLAHISGGRPGYAIRLYQFPGLLEQRQSWLQDLLRIFRSPVRERFEFAFKRVENKEEMRSELQIWLTFWRDVLIYSTGITDPLTNLDYQPQISRLADELGLSNAQFQVEAIERTIDRIDRNVNPRLALEVLLLDYPRIDFSLD